MNLISVYARKEPADDGAKGKYDVQVYRLNGEPFGRFPWFYKTKPTRRNKYVTLNCYKWGLLWS